MKNFIVQCLVNFEHTLIMILFPLMCILILGMTVSRITGIATGHFLWAEEAARYLMIWMAFLAAILAAKSSSHFRMTALTGAIKSPGLRKAVELLAILCSLAIMAVILYYGYRFMNRMVRSRQSSPVMMIPMWVPYLAIPVGFAGMFVRTVIHGYKMLTTDAGAAGREESQGEELT